MQSHGRMSLWTKLIGALTVFLVVSNAVVSAGVDVMNLPPSHIDLCPNAYLLEFSSEPGGFLAAQEARAIKAKIRGMKSVRIRQEFGVLLNAISVQVEDQDELREIMTLHEIVRVSPLTVVSPPDRVQPTQNALVTSALNMTGVTRVHSELKLKGKGIKVGVIDTGIDFTHPALGGCFGANCRVAYGYDFVGDDYNGKNTPKPSEIPMDCAGHGSHVAGIIGASSDIIVGVAPEGAYRVLGCEGSTNDDLILAALERAVSEKMDVINLSIGESNGWPYNPLSRAVSKAKAMGVIITVSQGNDDKLGLSNIPGLNSTLPLVAALNGTQFGLGCESFQVDLTGKVVVVMRGSCNFSVKAQHALDKGAVGILFANNVPDVFSASIGPLIFPYAGISQADGQRLFDSLKANTKTQDGRMSTEVMSFFNVTPIPFVNEAGGSTSQFSSYGLDNELHIKPDIGAPGENIYSTWPVRNGSYATLSGTSMASPHVAGALALALQHFRGITGRSTPPTWPQVQRIYETFKNTAEPSHVFKNHTPFDLFADTAELTQGGKESGPVKPAAMSGSEAITSVAKQGSGMINIYRALTSLGYGLRSTKAEGALGAGEGNDGAFPPIRSTFVSPASLELNDTEFASGQHQMLTIHNYGPETVQYELSHLPAESLHELSIEAKQVKLKSSNNYTAPSPDEKKYNVQFVDAEAKVVFSSSFLTVPAGGQRRVSLRILPPQGIPADQHWIYSGYIAVRAVSASMSTAQERVSTSELIHVPYAGVRGAMKTLPIFLRPTATELRANNRTSLCQVLGSGIANATDFVYSFEGENLPILSFCVMNPTRFLLLDLISAGKRDDLDINRSLAGKGEEAQSLEADYEVYGRIASNDFVPRSEITSIVSAIQWDGTLDLKEGHDSNNTYPVKDREMVHHEPGRDLIYGMRAKTANDRQNEVSDTGNRLTQLIQRDDTEAGSLTNESRNDGRGKHRSRKDLKGKSAEDRSTVPEGKNSRNLHLLKLAHGQNRTNIPVPDGRYRLRLRALRILGDIDNSDDYDVWITRNFAIQRTGAKVPAFVMVDPATPK
ncbi:hypothetical protein BGZ58_002670 [Dissophora ornata]|nr:hypothetical protein BGZ58_002670 [Dissophora ornata]